jgi:hypothetical protein
VFLVILFLASLLRSWASSFEIFRFLLGFFLGAGGHPRGFIRMRTASPRSLRRRLGDFGVQCEVIRAVYD